MTWATCLKEMHSDKSKHFPHGISFDKEWRIVFSEQELNELLIPLGEASSNMTELQVYCWRRFGCAFPNISETDEVEIFDTTKIFFQEEITETSSNVVPFRVGIMVNSEKRNFDFDSTFNLMVYMAKNFNIECYFFTSKDVNLESKTVNAVLIEGSTRTPKTIPLPKICYNHFGAFTKENRKILKPFFEKECFLVNSYVFLEKQKMYNMLVADGKFKKFLIESFPLGSFENFLELFNRYNNNVVVKPIAGMQGKGVTWIRMIGSDYAISFKQQMILLKTEDELSKFYEEHFSQRGHLLQPYIISRTKYGTPFDIRIHARRGAEGKFEIFSYPRIGRNPDGFLSNLAAGGYTMKLLQFLKQEYDEDCIMLHEQLVDFGKTFADHYQSLFDKRISSIGIDLGIVRHEKSYELKIFEVQCTGPGYGGIPIEAAFSNLRYLQYLGECMRKGTLE